MPTTFVLEHDDRPVGYVYGDPFQVVYGGPDPAVVERRTLLARDEPVRAPDPEGAVPRGSMLQPAPGPKKAVGLAVALVNRTDIPLSTTELDGEAGAEARATLDDRHPTLFRDREDIPLGVNYFDAKVEELATDLDLPETTVEDELSRRRDEAPSTRAAVQAMREAHDAPLDN